jgi:hypothetical protein
LSIRVSRWLVLLNGERNVRLQPTLAWAQGGSASLKFNVYLGTSSNAVASPTTNSLQYKGRFNNPSFNLAEAGKALMLSFRPSPPPQPFITGTSVLPGGSFTLNGMGIANEVWMMSLASNLNPPVVWAPLARNAADGNGLFQFTDDQATSFLQRFYRIATP